MPSDTQDGGARHVTQRTSDITFRNNLFTNFGYQWDTKAGMIVNLLSGVTPADMPARINFIHNTVDNGKSPSLNAITDFGEAGGAVDSVWSNNALQHGNAGFRSNTSSADSATNIRQFLPGGRWEGTSSPRPSRPLPRSAILVPSGRRSSGTTRRGTSL